MANKSENSDLEDDIISEAFKGLMNDMLEKIVAFTIGVFAGFAICWFFI